MAQPVSGRETLPDGRKLYVRRWPADTQPARAVIFIVHGMGETADYYEEFAAQSARRGFAVVLPEMRGHGRTAGDVRSPAYRLTGGNPGPDSLHGMVRDLSDLAAAQRRQAPALPVFLLGHSMGAVVAQLFAGRYGSALSGLILTGVPSSAPVPAMMKILEQEIARNGIKAVCQDTFQAMFGHANEPFEPVRTPMDWITGDLELARQTLAMPYTSVLFTNEFYRDFLLAMRETDNPAAWSGAPRRLPIFLLGGGSDVMGENGETIRQKQRFLEELGFCRVAHRVFPGLRHSILRDTRRQEVAETIFQWLAHCVPETAACRRIRIP